MTTVGRIQADPNYPAIVPGKVTFTIDARHPEPGPLAELYAHHEALMRDVASRRGLEVSWHTTLDLPPSPSDPATVQLLQASYFKDMSLIMAGVTLSVIPLIVMFFIAGRQLVAGIMQGAVKG